MKKTLLTIALASMATASFAWMSVEWQTSRMFDYQDNNSIATQNAATKAILWDLVYTTETSVGTPTVALNEKTGKYEASYGSDKLLASRYWDPAKSSIMSVTEWVSDDNWTDKEVSFNAKKGVVTGEGAGQYDNATFDASSGKVYAAIFQFVDNNGTIDVYWANTGLYVANGWDGKNPPVAPFADVVGTWADDGVVIKSSLGSISPSTGVPEPATMSLLGLGALAMVIRRKLRK